ncbi:MAG: DUF998 domain-containing protein [Bacteroidota bacterium]
MSVVLVLAACLYLVAGVAYFGFKKQGFSHFRHTISELGEYGSLQSKVVSWGLFLPVGVGLMAVAILGSSVVAGLAASIGTGYIVAAFFPCDVGSPMMGTWRQTIHNLGGFAQYAGGAYFIYIASQPLFPLLRIASALIFICSLLLSIESLPLRGLVQRFAEVLLFSVTIYLTINV